MTQDQFVKTANLHFVQNESGRIGISYRPDPDEGVEEVIIKWCPDEMVSSAACQQARKNLVSPLELDPTWQTGQTSEKGRTDPLKRNLA